MYTDEIKTHFFKQLSFDFEYTEKWLESYLGLSNVTVISISKVIKPNNDYKIEMLLKINNESIILTLRDEDKETGD